MNNPIWLLVVNIMKLHASLAQLVQSISFTPRGSEVRILQDALSAPKGRMTWPEIYSCKLDAESRAADLRDRLYARVVELVDTLDLGSSAEGFEGSSPSLSTKCSL